MQKQEKQHKIKEKYNMKKHLSWLSIDIYLLSSLLEQH